MTRLSVTSGTNYCVYIYEPSLLYDDAPESSRGQESIRQEDPSRNNNAAFFAGEAQIAFERLAGERRLPCLFLNFLGHGHRRRCIYQVVINLGVENIGKCVEEAC